MGREIKRVPQPLTSNVYGNLVKTSNGFVLACGSAHYADDAHWADVPSFDAGGYKVPSQADAAKLYGSRKTSPLVVGTVTNNQLGAPSGPLIKIELDPIQRKWDQEALSKMICYYCGEPLIDDPDGSPGVIVHQDRNLDNQHDPVPDVEE